MSVTKKQLEKVAKSHNVPLSHKGKKKTKPQLETELKRMYLEDLPEEMIAQVMIKKRAPNITAMCKTNKKMQTICMKNTLPVRPKLVNYWSKKILNELKSHLEDMIFAGYEEIYDGDAVYFDIVEYNPEYDMGFEVSYDDVKFPQFLRKPIEDTVYEKFIAHHKKRMDS